MRVLIAEDSDTSRELLLAVVAMDRELEVCGIAKNGQEAVSMCKSLGPAVVAMDIIMPVMNGFEATREIMAQVPTPIVIVSGQADVGEVKVSFEALKAGALAVLPKPHAPTSPSFDAEARHLIATLKAMAGVSVVRHRSYKGHSSGTAALHLPSKTPPPRPYTGKPEVVVIAASTGGPAVVHRILSELDPSPQFSLPIVVAQHIAEGFVEGMVMALRESLRRRVKLAEAGERLEPGTIYLAPDRHHMKLTHKGTFELLPKVGDASFCPSADILFTSAAESLGPGVVAVILTGMGSDGVLGLKAVKQRGGVAVAQDRDSCVVFGMPAEAIAAGVIDHVLAPPQISSWLNEIARSANSAAKKDLSSVSQRKNSQ